MNPMDHYPADPDNPVEKSLRHPKKLIVSSTKDSSNKSLTLAPKLGHICTSIDSVE